MINYEYIQLAIILKKVFMQKLTVYCFFIVLHLPLQLPTSSNNELISEAKPLPALVE